MSNKKRTEQIKALEDEFHELVELLNNLPSWKKKQKTKVSELNYFIKKVKNELCSNPSRRLSW